MLNSNDYGLSRKILKLHIEKTIPLCYNHIGDFMHTKDTYIFSVILVIILSAVTLFTTFNITVTFLIFGLIMITITLRSLSERNNHVISASMLVLTLLYSVFSGNIPAFLIMYECRINRFTQIILPPLSYLIFAMITGEKEIPLIIFRVIAITVIAILFALFEYIIQRFYNTRNSVSSAVSATALGELYTKKLNQELVIKNFLVDKNARLEERENISRNIHNSVGHSITAAIMTLEAADILFEKFPEKAHEKILTAKERIGTGLDSIRQAVRLLDTDTSSISLSDFISGINNAADEFVMDTMRKIHTDYPQMNDELYIPREHTEFLTGAFKELLSNGVKHGNADVFFLHITADSTHIKLTVKDNGKSDFSAENAEKRMKEGFGLKKLLSYAERCGGTASFVNENGFRTEIILPFEGGKNE